jgi:hypothetical protein
MTTDTNGDTNDESQLPTGNDEPVVADVDGDDPHGDEYRFEDDGYADLPIGEDGEVDWDAYYSDPRLWERVNADIAARNEGRVPIIARSSANGSVVAAMMLGIRNVFEDKPKQEIVFERDDSGDPDNPDKPFHLDFDPDDPTNTRAVVRPWARKKKKP